MDRIDELLHSVLGNDPPSMCEDVVVALSEFLWVELQEQSWFPHTKEEWGQQCARHAAQLIVDRICEMKERVIHPSIVSKTIGDILTKPVETFFVIPEAIRLIYSDHPPEFDAFVHEGAKFHCLLVRRAASQAVRKHVAGMKRASFDTQELVDELYGVVMEELVRCIGDPSARIWERYLNPPAVYPSAGARGMRRGMILRVALSKEGNRLASVRSDAQVFVWDLSTQELVRSWDLNLLDGTSSDIATVIPEAIYFSQNGVRIALETQSKRVIVLSMEEGSSDIQVFNESSKNDFLRVFGTPFLSDHSLSAGDGFTIQTRTGLEMVLAQYSQLIYDWSWDESNRTLATASEIERVMPLWMRRAGFERAVFHIAKKRLIDLIRKRTHTHYACWRCGSMISGLADTQCRRCGADFTVCPIACGCKEPLNLSNRWQCPSCGMTSRTAEAMVEVEMEDWYVDSRSTEKVWQDDHDMERILDVLKNVSVAYRRKDIPCDRLIVLKAEGKTNEEIGTDLGIPRGSVDYIWNQCKQQIILAFGEK